MPWISETGSPQPPLYVIRRTGLWVEDYKMAASSDIYLSITRGLFELTMHFFGQTTIKSYLVIPDASILSIFYFDYRFPLRS